MPRFTAIGEVDIAPSNRRRETWAQRLTTYPLDIRRTNRLTTQLIITVEAAVVEAAAAEALRALQLAAGQLKSFEIMTAEEHELRTDQSHDNPNYLGASDVARRLGVTRQRVQQLAAAGVLPSIKVGDRTLAFPRAAVRAIVMGRVSGRDIMSAGLEVIKRRPDLQPRIRKIMPVLASADRSSDGEQSAKENTALLELGELLDLAGVAWPTPAIDVVRGW